VGTTADVAIIEEAAASPEVSVEPAEENNRSSKRCSEEAVSAYLAEMLRKLLRKRESPFSRSAESWICWGPIIFRYGYAGDWGQAGGSVSPAVTPSAEPRRPAFVPVATPAARKVLQPPIPAKRDNSMQKINRLDVKGRIQLALKGNKEERSILIRDGTRW